MISNDLIGIAKAIDMATQIPKRVRQKIHAEFTMVGDECIALTRKLTPVDTGYLLSRDQISYEFGMFRMSMTISNDAPYADFVCFGTRYVKGRDFMTPAMVLGRKHLSQHFRVL